MAVGMVIERAWEFFLDVGEQHFKVCVSAGLGVLALRTSVRCGVDWYRHGDVEDCNALLFVFPGLSNMARIALHMLLGCGWYNILGSRCMQNM